VAARADADLPSCAQTPFDHDDSQAHAGIVKAIVVAGSAVVAHIQDESGGAWRLLRFDRVKSGAWKVTSVTGYTVGGYERVTGLAPAGN
jgi:hypothetical protein